MKTWTVGDLREFLQSAEMSPEDASRRIPLSNMTLRRYLKKPDRTRLPTKYAPHFDSLFGTSSGFPTAVPKAQGQAAFFPATNLPISSDFDGIYEHLATMGKDVGDEATIRKQLKAKTKNFGGELVETVSALTKAMTSAKPSKAKLAALGALLYFINPIDMVPDSLAVFGYIDDLSILSLALRRLSDTDSKTTGQEPTKT